MGIYLAKNNAVSTLASPLTSIATSLTIQTGHGDRFPVITGSDYTYVTLEDANGNIEVLKLTARALGSDTMTVERNQFSSGAKSWLAGDVIECRPVAQLIQDTVNHATQTSGAHSAAAITNAPAGNIASTDVQGAINELDNEKFAKTGGNITGEVQLSGSPGSIGQVVVSQGAGSPPIWGSSTSFQTTGTGTGALYITSPNATDIPLVDLAALNNNVAYRVADSSGSEYEVGNGSVTYSNTGGSSWTQAYGDFDNCTAYQSAYGAGVRVVVGSGGVLLTTADEVNWTRRDAGFGSSAIYGVAFVGGQFIAVGQLGKLATSPDGITWTQRASAATAMAGEHIFSVAYDGSVYVIVGNTGYIASSTDGITWTNRKSSGSNLYGVTWGNGHFIAVGASGTMFESSNGTTWNSRTSGFGTTGIERVAYGLVGATPTMVAVGQSGVITYSTDASFSTWSSATSPFSGDSIYEVIFANNGFIAGGGGGKVSTSSNGSAWTATQTVANAGLRALSYGNSIYLAMDWPGDYATSTDASTWNIQGTKMQSKKIAAATYGASTFLIAGASGKLSTSTDAITWTARTSGFSNTINAAIYAGGKFVICGDTDGIATSSDAATWSYYTGALSGDSGYALTYGNSVYVIAGTNGKLFTSATALSGSWTSRTSGFGTTAINGLAYANVGGTNTFVAVGNGGKISRSVDGSAVTWALQTSPVATNLLAVAYGNGRFVAVGASGTFLYSSDGATWAQATDVTSAANANALMFSNGVFVAVCTSGIVATSPDGITWLLAASDLTADSFWSVCASGTKFIAGSGSGYYATSAPGVPALYLARTTPYFSSNANSAVSFSAGTKSAELIPAEISGSNGLVVRNSNGTTARTIAGTANQVTVTNGDGVSGNPTLSLPTVAQPYGKQTIWIPAGGMTVRTTGGAAAGSVETTTNKVVLSTLDYDPTTAKYAQFSVAMPKSWDNGTMTAQFIWSHPSTTTNFGVVWGLQGLAVSDTDAMDASFGTAQEVTDTGGATDAQYISQETSAITIAGSPASGDTVVFQAYRNAASGSDTLAVNARLHGVRLYFTTTAGNDA